MVEWVLCVVEDVVEDEVGVVCASSCRRRRRFLGGGRGASAGHQESKKMGHTEGEESPWLGEGIVGKWR